MLPCLIFEDEHLLVVNKPAGWNTHAPSPYAGEGIYEWLRGREPRWEHLAIIQRLDKETSGLLVFAKTSVANRSLTAQFAGRAVRKKYLLLTDRPTPEKTLRLESALVRAGLKYLSRPVHAGGQIAETWFRPLPDSGAAFTPAAPATGALTSGRLVEAEPLTGRTHQIRVHAAALGLPILGDTLYGGTPAPRVCLHAARLAFQHPASGAELSFAAPADFGADPRFTLRAALIEPETTNSWRVIHGASDRWPGWYVDRVGDFLLSQGEALLNAEQREELLRLMRAFSLRGVYHKRLTRHLSHPPETASPHHVLGEPARDPCLIRENGRQFELSFREGYSVGLFLDQRDNRRRLLTGYVGPGFYLPWSRNTARVPSVLNAFGYTCGFSVCAAGSGARVTSLDLSIKYLEWGKRNFALNRLEPGGHDFIFGDVFDWCNRLQKKARRFDLVLLDPPTFSRSKVSGIFRAERDYGKLVAAILPLLNPGGVLFASTNAADWPPEDFVGTIERAVSSSSRKLEGRHYAPQPPDFPISKHEPAYLKIIWLQLD
jgi:23S rRNA (cytosine1962-C5)-methyltransferase